MKTSPSYTDLEEMQRLASMLGRFFAHLHAKVIVKTLQGRRGWDRPSNEAMLKAQFKEHTGRYFDGDDDQLIDIAILAAFLWNLQQKGGEIVVDVARRSRKIKRV